MLLPTASRVDDLSHARLARLIELRDPVVNLWPVAAFHTLPIEWRHFRAYVHDRPAMFGLLAFVRSVSFITASEPVTRDGLVTVLPLRRADCLTCHYALVRSRQTTSQSTSPII